MVAAATRLLPSIEMTRVRLIHWNATEAEERAERLRRAGFEPDADGFEPSSLRGLAEDPPAAVVIDLGRLPSHGREVALALRERKGTRGIPIVFVGGEAAKVERTRALLPDATYASWRGIKGALSKAIASPPAEPVVPSSRLAGYSGTPLPRKLGIKASMTVALLGAPEGFEQTLGELPEGVTLRTTARGKRELTLWFVTTTRELEAKVDRLAAAVGDGGLWIAWPKKGSALASDVTQSDVRRVGLGAGLVDFKICAIDANWSGLRFSRRKG